MHLGLCFLSAFYCSLCRGKGPAKAIDTFALQRDLGKLDQKVSGLMKKMDESLAKRHSILTGMALPPQLAMRQGLDCDQFF